MDPDGKMVTLKGFALSGLEIGLTMSGDLTEGKDSIAHDWDTVMYRYKLHTYMLSQTCPEPQCNMNFWIGFLLFRHHTA